MLVHVTEPETADGTKHQNEVAKGSGSFKTSNPTLNLFFIYTSIHWDLHMRVSKSVYTFRRPYRNKIQISSRFWFPYSKQDPYPTWMQNYCIRIKTRRGMDAVSNWIVQIHLCPYICHNILEKTKKDTDIKGTWQRWTN